MALHERAGRDRPASKAAAGSAGSAGAAGAVARRSSARAAWVLAAAAAAVTFTTTEAPGRLIFAAAIEPAARGTADPQQGVYVRDSAIAADKFELGKRMERLREWHKSADVYQDLLKNYKDRVVPTRTNDKGQAEAYASVVVAVQGRLSRWPEEGLVVYRNRFEPEAATLLEKAGRDDVALLHQVFESYFATESAKVAGTRLMDAYMESGEFAEAAGIGDRLLEMHPNLKAERGGVLYRTIMAHHLSGNAEAARQRLSELSKDHAREIATIAGKDRNLVEAVTAQLAVPPPTLAGLAGDSYPTFSGGPSRSEVAAGGGKAGALVHSTKLPGPVLASTSEQTRASAQAAFEDSARTGNSIGVIPAVDRGELFFQDGFRVFALHVESGVPLAGWAQTWGGSRAGQFWLPAPAQAVGGITDQWLQQMVRAPRQHTVTVTDDAVLAVMGLPEPRMNVNLGAAAAANLGQGGTKLVCLDRATGRVRWMADPNNLPNNPGNAKNLSFSGSPLVVGDNVYVIARGSNAGVEDCQVFCYELSRGTHRWACYIASSQTGNMAAFAGGGWQMPSMDTVSHLAFAGGKVFVNTNLGAVAAVDAYGGATAWLTIYPREELRTINPMRGIGGWAGPGIGGPNDQNAAKPWHFNPVIVSEGKVFVLPLDGRFVHVYDAASGEEVRRFPREIQAFGNDVEKLSMLLGVTGDRLMLGAEGRVFCIDWKKYQPKGSGGRKLDVDNTYWMAPFDKIRGRPFLTKDYLFVPMEKAVCMVDLGNGKVRYRYPPHVATWPEGEDTGNVVVTADHVIVAGAKQVNVYTDLQDVRDKYLTQVRADPNNVEAHLVFGELMFNARQLPEAIKALDEGIARLGGLEAMAPGALRDRVFGDCILFANRVGGDRTVEGLAMAEELFDRAEKAALTASQRVNYRLSRARFIEGLADLSGPKPDYARAAALYQQILADPDMRIISLVGEDPNGPKQAGKVAEEAIRELIRRVGPRVYEPFEREAAEALAAVGEEGKADELLAISEKYPNSRVARQAMMQAAARYEKAGDARMATQVLRRLYWKYASSFEAPERAKLIEAMARNHLKVGSTGAALGRLMRIVPQETPLSGPLVLGEASLKTADGREVRTVAEAVSALQAMAARRADRALPDMNLPPRVPMEEKLAGKKAPPPFVAPGPDAVIAGVQALLLPPSELAELTVTDRVLTWQGGKLVCYPAGKNAPLWTSEAITEDAQGCAWLGAGSGSAGKLLVWGASEVAILDPDKGTVTWKQEVRALPPVETITTGTNDGPVALGPAGADEDALAANDVIAARQLRAAQLAGARAQVLAARAVAVAPGAVAVGAAPAQPAAGPAGAAAQAKAADGRERVLHVRPLTDRVVVSTTTGRVVVLSLDGGRPLWQTRLPVSNQPFAQTLATDEFVVVRSIQGNLVTLTAFDAFNGQQLYRRAAFTNQGNYPLNAALSEDGTLVWTTPTSIVGKDLYEPGDAPTWDRQARRYAGLTRPEQLAVTGQHVFAVCDGGQIVERRSLRSGDVMSSGQMSTASRDAGVVIRLIGPRLYSFSSQKMMTYHLEHGTESDAPTLESVTLLPDAAMLTRQYTVLPGAVGNAPDGTYMVLTALRDLIVDSDSGKPRESGLKVHMHKIAEPSKIRAFHAVEGGLYYLTGDERLVFLKGNGPGKP